MTIQQYALIDVNGIWQNTVLWDGMSNYTPPSGWMPHLVSALPAGGSLGATLNGGTWTAPVVAVTVPQTVAMWQAKAALQAANLLTPANNAVTAANNEVLTLFWQTATNIDRSSPTLASIGAALNLTSAQVDALFVAAASISL